MADVAASVLARLKNRAQISGRSYQLCLQLFCQEEFLRRLEKSKYAENLVLKGGLFIYSLTDFDSRVTVDVDFLLRQMPNTPEQLKTVLEEIIAAPTGNDFITFEIIGFGYPNSEELQLGVTTKLKIDEQIKNQTKLSYTDGENKESLPSTHNGLGYKNLIKMEFLLVAFAKDVAKRGEACIPLLFIEEPESHMHPQMQHAFAEYLEDFLGKISNVHIQTFLTSHSAHIANTMDFSKIRYAQKKQSRSSV